MWWRMWQKASHLSLRTHPAGSHHPLSLDVQTQPISIHFFLWNTHLMWLIKATKPWWESCYAISWGNGQREQKAEETIYSSWSCRSNVFKKEQGKPFLNFLVRQCFRQPTPPLLHSLLKQGHRPNLYASQHKMDPEKTMESCSTWNHSK